MPFNLFSVARDIDNMIIETEYSKDDYIGRYVVVDQRVIYSYTIEDLQNMAGIGALILSPEVWDLAKQYSVSRIKINSCIQPEVFNLHAIISFYFSSKEEFIYKLDNLSPT